MIELDIVDLVCGLGLEPLQNDRVFLLGNLHAEVVKDGAETGEGDEARTASVLVLEVRLDQKAAVLHVSAQAFQRVGQNSLLICVEHILGVKN